MCIWEVSKCSLDGLSGNYYLQTSDSILDLCTTISTDAVPQDVGVTQKVLHLVSSGGAADCPRQKLVSRKCGRRRRKQERKRNRRRNKKLSKPHI